MIAGLLLALAAPGAAAVQPEQLQEAPAVEVWIVDRLKLSPSTPKAALDALIPDHTMDAVIAHLKALGVPYTRDQVGLVPSRMPAELRESLAKLPDGEPFIIPDPEFVSINVIVRRQLPPDTVRYVPPAPRLRAQES